MDSTFNQAVLHTLVYADLFDYPLSYRELHRQLQGLEIAYPEFLTTLERSRGSSPWRELPGGFLGLPGRTQALGSHQERRQRAAGLLDRAIAGGRSIARLPYVRMVALTGGVAAGNALPEDDFDYLIVSQPGRVWLCRAFIILMVRWMANRSPRICPNFIVSERRLQFPDHSLYTAMEIVQMIPIAGMPVYRRLRAENRWVDMVLPNAGGPPGFTPSEPSGRIGSQMLEGVMDATVGGRLESWEMTRKVGRFSRMDNSSTEICFDQDRCQGHFGGHREQTLRRYTAQLIKLGLIG